MFRTKLFRVIGILVGLALITLIWFNPLGIRWGRGAKEYAAPGSAMLNVPPLPGETDQAHNRRIKTLVTLLQSEGTFHELARNPTREISKTKAGENVGKDIVGVVKFFTRNAHARHIDGTSLIELTVSGADPADSRILLHAWGLAFLDRQRERASAVQLDRTTFFNHQRLHSESRLKDVEPEQRELMAQLDGVDVDRLTRRINALDDRLFVLEQRWSALDALKSELEALAANPQPASPAFIPESLKAEPRVVEATRKLDEARRRLAEARSKAANDAPPPQPLLNEAAQHHKTLNKVLLEELTLQQAADARPMEELRKQMNSLLVQKREAIGIQARISRLETERAELREKVVQFKREIDKAMAASSSRESAPAEWAEMPWDPYPSR